MAGGVIQSQRGTGGRRRSHRPLAEINVTPLVDVMLVLLIVFMVTAPLLTTGVHVDLPKSKAAPMSQSDDKPLEISIDKDGQIFLQKTAITIDELVPKLNAISNENHDAKIYIRGDKANSWGTMMEVLGAVGGAGYGKVGLVSNPSDGTPSKRK
ncbi:MAG TPA: protein TolR [Alphaproteobacteria bacterium]|jgi:biopolymer transport protein TolR|nr:protein TolR [Alphaproteobacteria bacterium]